MVVELPGQLPVLPAQSFYCRSRAALAFNLQATVPKCGGSIEEIEAQRG